MLPEPVTHTLFEDEELVAQDVNPAFAETFGSERASIIGRSINDVVVSEDLLTVTREGQSVTDGESIHLATLAEPSWATVDTVAATLLTDTDRVARADRRRLQQLLENLVRNAVEHGGEDVTVTVGDLADATGFFVADDGPGVPT